MNLATDYAGLDAWLAEVTAACLRRGYRFDFSRATQAQADRVLAAYRHNHTPQATAQELVRWEGGGMVARVDGPWGDPCERFGDAA